MKTFLFKQSLKTVEIKTLFCGRSHEVFIQYGHEEILYA